jgi:hypothetical protein
MFTYTATALKISESGKSAFIALSTKVGFASTKVAIGYVDIEKDTVKVGDTFTFTGTYRQVDMTNEDGTPRTTNDGVILQRLILEAQ